MKRSLTTAAALFALAVAVADSALARPPVHVPSRPKVMPTAYRPVPPRVVRPVVPAVVCPVPVRYPAVSYLYRWPVVAPPVYVPSGPVVVTVPPQVMPVIVDDDAPIPYIPVPSAPNPAPGS